MGRAADGSARGAKKVLESSARTRNGEGRRLLESKRKVRLRRFRDMTSHRRTLPRTLGPIL